MKFRSALTAAQLQVLEDLHGRDRRERRDGIREALNLRAVAPEVAQLLYLLVVQKGARAIVEFGTSHGYSTIHLAAAATRTGGHVYSVDLMPEKTALAAANLEAAGLSGCVTLATSDGADFVGSLPSGIDFVLVDYEIAAFARAFAGLRAGLAPGCFVFVDGGPDGYWQSGAGRDFRTLLEGDPAFIASLLPMGKEQLVAVRIAG